MERMRKRYPPSFKAKVALEAIKEHKTSAELASLYQVRPGQIRNWKAVVLTNGSTLPDRNYFILFTNPGKYVKLGNKVTVVIGDFRVENLVVE